MAAATELTDDISSHTDTVTEPIFTGVKFYILGSISSDIDELLRRHGASEESYLTFATHGICDDPNHEQLSELREVHDVPVVTSRWATLSARACRRLPLAAFRPDSDQLFSGVAAHLAGTTSTDRDKLWAMITYFGGSCVPPGSPGATHVVCGVKRGAEYQRCVALRGDGAVAMVTPDWVEDSVESGQKLPECDYDVDLLLDEVDMKAEQEAEVEIELEKIEKKLREEKVKEELETGLREEEERKIREEKEERERQRLIAVSEKDADDRRIAEALEAMKNKVVKKKKLNRSTAKSPKSAVDTACPSILPKSAPQPPAPPSPPVYLAHQPPVPPEGCLMACVFLLVDYPCLIEPSQLESWCRTVRAHCGETVSVYSARVTHVVCANQTSPVVRQALADGKRLVTAHWLNDCLSCRLMTPPSHALHFPPPFSPEHGPCRNHIIAICGFQGQDRERVKLMVMQVGALYTGYFSKQNTVLISLNKEGLKYSKAIEWRVPVVNLQWLCDLLHGRVEPLSQHSHQRYQTYTHPDPFLVDTRMMGAFMGPWTNPIRVSRSEYDRYCAAYDLRLFNNNGEESTRPPCKRLKSNNGGSARASPRSGVASDVRIVITGVDEATSGRVKHAISRLGFALAARAADATHLVADRVVRTVKFMTCISSCRFVVTPSWLEACEAAQSGRVPEERFLLRDPAAEAQYGCTVEEASGRASGKRLLDGMGFYVTAGVRPSAVYIRGIVEAAGGVMLDALPVAPRSATKRSIICAIISCDADYGKLLGESIRRGVGVYYPELIYTGVLTQMLHLEQFAFPNPFS